LLEGDKPEDHRAIFLINEGTKQKVWKATFVGNTIASDDRLRTQIKSKPPFLYLFKGELDRKEVDEDVQRLTAYYRGLGFFRARIGRELEYNEKEDWVTIHFTIDEGPRYKIRNVSVLGNTKYTSEKLMADLKLKNGEYFNQSKMTADLTSMQDQYGGIGYVFADVKADPRFLEEPGQLDLVYNIKEGDRYRVGKIKVDIKGEYPHTQITTILNRLSFHPGDIVDIRQIRDSERRIKYSQLFESNPASGNAPKIVFSPPGQEADEEPENKKKSSVADRRRPEGKPGRRVSGGVGGGPGGASGGVGAAVGGPGSDDSEGEANFRGQSPDTPADRELNITLDCGRYIGPQESELQQNPEPQQHVNSIPAAPRSLPGNVPMRLLAGNREYAPARIAAGDDGLLQMAGDLADTLAQRNRRQLSRDGLILTQTTEANPGNSSVSPNNLRWTSASGVVQASNTEAPVQDPQAVNQNTQAQPVQPAPAYAQNWPRQNGPERAADSPEGPYMPGPIFSESSPFRDGPPDGGTTPGTLPFGISAEETMTGRLMFGVGVNSDSGLVGSVVLDEQNFDWTRFPNSWEDVRNGTAWRGAGQRFRMEAAPGTTTQRYLVSFQEPFLFGSQYSLGLSGYYYSRIYTEYTEQRLGGRVAIGYQLTPDLSTTVAYRGANIKLSNPIDPLLPTNQYVNGHNVLLGELCSRDLALHGFQATLTHDKRDNAFLATEGHLIEASVEEVLGTFQYPHAEVDLRKYFTLYERPDGSGRHVLTLAGRAGYTGDETPIYERYYAGGYSTIRGFQFRGASPREAGPSTGGSYAIGGNFEMLGSAEYMFPITADDMLRAVVFCDSGTVEPTITNWSNKYRVAPGFGLRICVPAMGPAPIALDFAFPISWQPGDKSELFSFFMGFGR
jgi:outer membrane protein insertion porin family